MKLVVVGDAGVVEFFGDCHADGEQELHSGEDCGGVQLGQFCYVIGQLFDTQSLGLSS